ncbi:MAG TPA: hypothetical protein VFW09_19850 [Solirubrobacteraceae bacterium]|nr:hypothetical protein [Solirubrobacteraceae bacterium]
MILAQRNVLIVHQRPASAQRPGALTLFVRYGIGGIMVVAGIVLLIVNPGGFGVDGFSMSVGAGLSVLLLNWMYRLGVSGDRERDREELARRYLEEHGHWPDEEPRRRQHR